MTFEAKRTRSTTGESLRGASSCQIRILVLRIEIKEQLGWVAV
jgi:hypothetical protein